MIGSRSHSSEGTANWNHGVGPSQGGMLDVCKPVLSLGGPLIPHNPLELPESEYQAAPLSSIVGGGGHSREGRWGRSISSLVSHGFRWAICSPNSHRSGARAWGGADNLPHLPPTQGQVHLDQKTTTAREPALEGGAGCHQPCVGWGCLTSQLPAGCFTGHSPCTGSCRWKPGSSGLREP